ncbi:unnamed protein product [Spirodela intermedia]|uniref:C2 domain-containing protein n=1 Tax=Spirodela intermedia TaxID=51605 RepID=A0A7I8KAH0_SPIIN|nr:unnamed protein product [Spirodela intermedia]
MAGVGTVRKLVVEVVEARGLVPKDGGGSASPYAVVDFDGQRKRTRTVTRSLNPSWNESLLFDVSFGGDAAAAGEPLEIELLHDRKVSPTRRSHFLGRVRLDPSQFVSKGEEALVHYPLQKKSFFSWIRGDLALRVFFSDEPAPAPPVDPPPPPEKLPDVVPPSNHAVEQKAAPPSGEAAVEAGKPGEAADQVAPPAGEAAVEAGKPVEAADQAPPPAPDAAVEAGKAGEAADQMAAPPAGEGVVPQEDLTKEEAAAMEQQLLQPPPPLSQRQVGSEEGGVERSSFDLVDKMQYLFVRVVKARSLPGGAANPPHVRIAVSGSSAATGPAMTRAHPTSFEWDHTFAFPRPGGAADQEELPAEVSVWDGPPVESPAAAPGKRFLGSVRLDVSEVSDGPPAAQWYRVAGAGEGELMLATWVGTQADESFHGATKADGGASSSRSKVYLSPKLWYLRLTVVNADDLLPLPSETAALLQDAPVWVRATLGFQSLKTRSAALGRGGTLAPPPSWEDLLFVVAEPLGDQAVEIAVEARRRRRHGEEPATVLGCAHVALSAVERRVDDRHVAPRWLDLLPPPAGGEEAGGAAPRGRLQVRVCLDGGYHVTDEPPHAASDFRPSARQLWRRPVGAVELGIIGCRNLLPVKSTVGTAAYVVARYGSKWARTRTVATSMEPTWNEQYTWPIFDPATVLTVAVFDESATACRPLGRVRIRISALESGCAYRISYPLFLLGPTGLHRTGEIDLAVRFARAGSPLDILHVYGQPVLPLMHHLRPIGGLRRDHLRSAAARLVAAHLARSEPSLPNEAVMHVLEADGESRGGFSMRRMRASWNRAAAALSWVASVARWMESMRTWRNPTATILAHGVLVLLIWHPDLIVPAVAIHVAMVGVWNRRKSARGAASTGHVCLRASQLEATAQLADELDEELDPSPSAKPPEVVRARYDRLRAAVWRAQNLLDDVAAQAERLQSLVTWRDPRATAIFVVACLVTSAVLLAVPTKVAAAAAGFYWLRHPVFRGAAAAAAPPRGLNFFRRLPTLSDRIM